MGGPSQKVEHYSISDMEKKNKKKIESLDMEALPACWLYLMEGYLEAQACTTMMCMLGIAN